LHTIRVLNKTFNESGIEQHPDKTLIGRTERGFYFLGYFLKPSILSVSKKPSSNSKHVFPGFMSRMRT
jgi:hypothetical protein